MSWLYDFLRDLAHGARLLRRHPTFTAVAVSTLALGIGATVSVFSVADAWLFKPLAFPQSEKLVVAFAARPERPAEPAVWLTVSCVCRMEGAQSIVHLAVRSICPQRDVD
jgi:hypothetical protein